MTINKLNISVIKEMLYMEIKDYYSTIDTRKEIESNIDFLNQMINLLETKDYELIYDNLIIFHSFLPIFFNENNAYETILNKLFEDTYLCKEYNKDQNNYSKEDYEKAQKDIQKLNTKLQKILEIYTAKALNTNPVITKNQMLIYKSIIRNLKNGNTQKKKEYEINTTQYEELLKLFERKNLTEKQKIILLEKIKGHNISLHIPSKKINYEKLNEIINMELLGFEEIENISWISSDRKRQLDNIIETIKLQGIDEEITIQLLPVYNKDLIFSEGYDLTAVKYIYTSLLRYYQNELLEIQNELNLKNYLEHEYRNFIVELYKENIKSYLLIRKKMNEEIEKYNKDIEKVSEEEDVYKISYAAKESGLTYFESDLKFMEKDTYRSIIELIIKFKKGKTNLKETKNLTHALHGNQEIKDDQIRIIYRHLKDNEYVILGVFSKKDNNLASEYNKIFKRSYNILIENDDIEESLFNEIINKSHLGGRRNIK